MKKIKYILKKSLKYFPKIFRSFVLEHWSLFDLKNYYSVKGQIESYAPIYIKFDSLENTKRLLKKIALSGKKGLITCKYLCNEQIKRIESKNIDKANLIVICVVKNEIGRIAKWLEYYRKLGVKAFAIFDDNSTDGTREFLESQNDVEVFVGMHDYNTIQKIAWINMIVAVYGYNRWYLFVDSDELFTYKNLEQMNINEYIENLKKHNKLVETSIMLDMYSSDNIFSVSSDDDFAKQCCYFDNIGYYLKKTSEANYIVGGVRKRIFDNTDYECLPVLSKKTLIYVTNNCFVYTAHTIFPFKYNYDYNYTSVLRHYKFLKEDYQNYLERIKKNNFFNASSEYKAYLNLYKNNNFIKLKNSKSLKWQTSYDIDKIEKPKLLTKSK